MSSSHVIVITFSISETPSGCKMRSVEQRPPSEQTCGHCGALPKVANGTGSVLDYLMDNEPCQTIIRLAFPDNSPNVQWLLVVANCNSLRQIMSEHNANLRVEPLPNLRLARDWFNKRETTSSGGKALE